MDSRYVLMDKIAGDVLSRYTKFSDVKREILVYSKLLSDVVRNYYEVEGDNDGRLFKLVYWVTEGKDNLGYTQEDYDINLDSMLQAVNKFYGTELSLKEQE